MSSGYFSQTKRSRMITNLAISVFQYTFVLETNLWLHSCIRIRGRVVKGWWWWCGWVVMEGGSAFIQCMHKLFKEQVCPRGMAVKVEDEVRDHRGLG